MIATRWNCDACDITSPANQKYSLAAWAHIVFGCPWRAARIMDAFYGGRL